MLAVTIATLVTLTAAEGSQTQASDAASLRQTHVLTGAEGSESQASDTATLGQSHVLVAQEGSQSQASDTPTLTQTHVLAATEGSQAQASDVATLTVGTTESGDYLVSDQDLALWRSRAKRFTLYAAILPAYVAEVSQRLREPGENMRDPVAWTPDAGLGPSKIGVVGSPVSYLFTAANRSGGAVGAANQSIDWGDGTVVSSVAGVVSHTYLAAGLYEALFTATDTISGVTFTAHRWVKIFAAWANAYDGIAEVSGLGGSGASGGSQASVKVTKATGSACTGDFPDGACIVLYALQEWRVDDRAGTSTVGSIGRASGYSFDPEYVFEGYLVGASVRVDAKAHSVTFQLETADTFLKIMTIEEHRFLDSTESGYGHVCTGLTYPDAVNHLVYQHTNWATWHSLYAWREWSTANAYKQIVLNKGTIWAALQSFAENEFARLQVNRHGSGQVVPNINVRGGTWWGSVTDPPILPFDSSTCFSIEAEEACANPRYGQVKLSAANPFKGTTLTAKYPSSPGRVGEVWTKDGLTCEVQALLDDWAEALYHWQNARWKIRVTTGMPIVLDVGQIVVVDYADPQGRFDFTAEVGGGSARMPWYVEDVSYPTFDPAKGRWTGSYSLGPIVNTRWRLDTHKWQRKSAGVWSNV